MRGQAASARPPDDKPQHTQRRSQAPRRQEASGDGIFDEVEKAARTKDVTARMKESDDLLTARLGRGLATPERQQAICSSSSLIIQGLACSWPGRLRILRIYQPEPLILGPSGQPARSLKGIVSAPSGLSTTLCDAPCLEPVDFVQP